MLFIILHLLLKERNLLGLMVFKYIVPMGICYHSLYLHSSITDMINMVEILKIVHVLF